MSGIITFRAKIETILNPDMTVAYRRIKVPTITKNHCDMNTFQTHPRLCSYTNSNMFESLVRRELDRQGLTGYIRLDNLRPNVTVDETAFLAIVTIRL